MPVPQVLAVQFEGEVLRSILDRGDLFKHDAPLKLQVFVEERGEEHQVGEHIERLGQMLIQHAGLEARVFPAGEGVQGTTQALEGERDLLA